MWPWSTIRKLRDTVAWQKDRILSLEDEVKERIEDVAGVHRMRRDDEAKYNQLYKSFVALREIAGKNADERDAAQAGALAFSQDRDRLKALLEAATNERAKAMDDFVRVQEQLLVAMKNDYKDPVTKRYAKRPANG